MENFETSSRRSKSLRYDAETYLLACCAHARLKAHKTRILMTTTAANPPPLSTHIGAVLPFAPRPQPSALSATPIVNQPIDAEEPPPVRQFIFNPHEVDLTVGSNRLWRESLDKETKTRNERSKTLRQTKSKAERAIDQFYGDYNAFRKRQIGDNKFVLHPNLISLLIQAGTELRKRNTPRS